MADYYVRPLGGSYGAEDGSDYSNAFDGFTDIAWGSGGAGFVGAGDRLIICGEHGDRLNINQAGTSLANPVIIDGNGYPADPGSINITTDDNGVHCYQNYVTIRNLTVKNDNAAAVTKKGILSGDQYGMRVENCLIEDFGGGIQKGSATGSGLPPDASLVVIDTEIRDAAGAGIYLYHVSDGGRFMDVTVERCNIHHNSGSGINLANGGNSSQGNKTAHIDGIYVRDCDLHHNGSSGLSMSIYETEAPSIVDDMRPRNFHMTYCRIFSNGGPGISLGGLFYDPANGVGRSRVAHCLFDDNSTQTTAGSMENIGSAGLLLEDCILTNGHTADLSFDGCGLWIDLVYTATDPLLAHDCIYRRNTVMNHTEFWNATTNTSDYFWALPPGNAAPPSAGVRILSAYNNEIYNNIFVNQNVGLCFTTHPIGTAPAGNKIYNNTFIDCQGAGVYFKDSTDLTNEIKNNIFVNQNVEETLTFPVYQNDGTQQELFNNLFYGFTQESSDYGAGAITTTGAAILTDGLSVDPGLDESYMPGIDSPVLGQGVPVLSRFDAYGRPHTGSGDHLGAVWPYTAVNRVRRKL